MTESQVQEKDVKDVENVNNGDKAETKGPYTMEELEKALQDDPELRDAFIADEEQFLKDHAKPVEEKSEPGDDEKTGEPVDKEPDKKDEDLPDEVQVTLKKDWLGTYAKNRKPEEAIEEMSKGNAEKDKTIDFFKKEKLPGLESEIKKHQETNKTLKEQLEEYKKRLETPKKKGELAIPEVTPLDMDDDDLFLSDDGQKKFKRSYTDMHQAVKALAQKVEDLSKPQVKEPEKKEETPDTDVQDKIQQEYSEIDSFVSGKKEVFNNPPPIELMETEYLDFMGNLAKVSNIDGPIQLENGDFNPKLRENLKSYLANDDQGKTLRKAMQTNNLTPLDEGKYNTLNTIYAVRAIKQELGVPYDVALELHTARTRPSEEELRLKGNVEGHERYAKAKANREGYVKQTPAQTGGGDAEIMKMPVTELTKIMDKKPDTWTEREQHIVKTVWKQKGASDKEIKSMFGF